MDSILTSFCHGYKNEDLIVEKRSKLPSILLVQSDLSKIDKVFELYYPRLPEDFDEVNLDCSLIGENPATSSTIDFRRKPRFGVMGLSPDDGEGFYAATWNGIYHFASRSSTAQRPTHFITNKLINDPHGIVFNGGLLYVVLTALDALVCINPQNGQVEWAFRIDRNLNCIALSDELQIDWRLIGKQDRGAVGNWHFNNITFRNGNLWLTSRLTSSVVEFDPLNKSAILRTFCWDTPVMIHDGESGPNESIIFTSVDGKVITANSPMKISSSMPSMKESGFKPFMQRDFITNTIRISEIKGHEINWCRGLLAMNNQAYTTIYGRYEQSKPYFSIFKLNLNDPHDNSELQVSYELIDYPSDIRYMTGFSIIKC